MVDRLLVVGVAGERLAHRLVDARARNALRTGALRLVSADRVELKVAHAVIGAGVEAGHDGEACLLEEWVVGRKGPDDRAARSDGFAVRNRSADFA